MASAAAAIPAPRWSIPPYDTGPAIIRRLGRLYRPREHLTVSQWAARERGFDPLTLPWQPEVMDALSDPEVAEVGLMGPAQAGKSEIGLAWIGWSIDHDPGDMLLCQPSQTMAQDFVVRRIEPMIEATVAVKSKLLPLSNANNIFLKQFRGMLLTTIWPVASQFAARPVPRGWLDDVDQYPDDIDGQGSAVNLLDGRQTTFEGRDTKFVSSSPADDEGGKIEAFVEGGTDERLMPLCPECGDRFEPSLPRDLHFDERGNADQAEATAHVICPANGCILEPSARRQLLDSMAELPALGFVAANEKASRRRRTFRVDGLLAFTTWPKLARLWRDAQIAWETRQDESALRAFMNTKAGVNYRSKLSGEKPLNSEDLKVRREQGFMLGTVPAGAKVLVTVVDVQFNRAECATIGYGEGLEAWLVDRWSIDALEDGLTQLAPFTHPEHSAALLPLFNRAYPLADGSGRTVKALGVGLDIGGGGARGEGATEFAKAFWHAARALGVHSSRITLLKGGNSPRADLMPRAKFADQKRRGGAKRNSPQLWLPNVHSIKNIIDARLRRPLPGPGYIHLPGGKVGGGPLRAGVDEGGTGRLLDQHVDEIAAEELKKGKWEKLRPRNETWDLLVYAYAMILRPPFAQSRTHMRWVPADFRVPDQDQPETLPAAPADKSAGEVAVSKSAKPADPTPTAPKAAKRAPAPTRKSWVKPRRGNWLDRRR